MRRSSGPGRAPAIIPTARRRVRSARQLVWILQVLHWICCGYLDPFSPGSSSRRSAAAITSSWSGPHLHTVGNRPGEQRTDLEHQIQHTLPGRRTASHRHRLTGQPVVLVDPFPPCGILRRVIFAHLSGERIKSSFQPEQLLLATVDVQVDRDVLRSSRPNSFRRKLTGSSFMGGALRPCCFTGLSRADLDPLHLMYLMVVVVAAVDAVDDVSLTQSETFWRCAYRCEEQEITRGGSWDGLPDDPTLPLIIPRLPSPRSTFPQCFPHLCGKHIPLPRQPCTAR